MLRENVRMFIDELMNIRVNILVCKIIFCIFQLLVPPVLALGGEHLVGADRVLVVVADEPDTHFFLLLFYLNDVTLVN